MISASRIAEIAALGEPDLTDIPEQGEEDFARARRVRRTPKRRYPTMTTFDRFCGIHAALRKGSDTDWSVLLWNMLNFADNDVWMKIVTHAAEVYPTLSAFPAAKLRAALTVEAHWEKQSETWKCQQTHDGLAIRKAFELCDDLTLRDVAAFIGLNEAEAVTVEVQV